MVVIAIHNIFCCRVSTAFETKDYLLSSSYSYLCRIGICKASNCYSAQNHFLLLLILVQYDAEKIICHG